MIALAIKTRGGTCHIRGEGSLFLCGKYIYAADEDCPVVAVNVGAHQVAGLPGDLCAGCEAHYLDVKAKKAVA